MLEETIKNLPTGPGVYQFFNKNNEILYIGKAKNLKSRVSSYFNQSKYQNYKTSRLAKQVDHIEHIVVESESDALLLENNLIKQYQPKYNILLKDDKTYPWICITNEPFPRIITTRNKNFKGAEYFGPYTSGYMVKTLLQFIREIYPLRTCKLALTPENIQSGKLKVCLEFHLGNCKGACEGLEPEESYLTKISEARGIIKGKITEVLKHMRSRMMEAASLYKFEDAEELKQKIEIIERYKAKSTIVSNSIDNVDVFGLVKDDNRFYINYLKVIQGSVINSHNIEITQRMDESDADIFTYGIYAIRDMIQSDAKEIILPLLVPAVFNARHTIPQRGDKLKLLELSTRNAAFYRKQVLSERAERSTAKRVDDRLEMVKTDLHLKELPIHIECFDNSNLQGTNPVAACVVFRNGKPAKSDYRKFNIKTVEGPDDFKSMEEVVYRRYKRLLDEQQSLPQLIVIDGGKGQLNAAVKSLKKLDIYSKLSIIGIAKRLEEIYYPFDKIPIYLDKKSYTLKLIQHLRNEAHRFGITFHRQKRSKSQITNSLETIQGIGPKTADMLIKRFGSLEQIKSVSYDELAKVLGDKKARALTEFLKE